MAVGEFLYLNVEHNPNDNMDNAQIVVKVNHIRLNQPVEVPQLYGYFVFNSAEEVESLKSALEDITMAERDERGNFKCKYTMELFLGRHLTEVRDYFNRMTTHKVLREYRRTAARQANVSVEVI